MQATKADITEHLNDQIKSFQETVVDRCLKEIEGNMPKNSATLRFEEVEECLRALLSDINQVWLLTELSAV